MMENLISKLEDKKILILGFGKEGRATFEKLRRWFPEKELGIADKNERLKEELSGEKVSLHLGTDYLQSVAHYDVVFKSPGVRLEKMPPGVVLTSQTDWFLTAFRDRMIGVTGTKGKSTTASLIYHFLKSAGKKVLLLGNIGVSAFEKLEEVEDDTLIVYELSAHQLQDVQHSPKTAVLLNIFPEHLDHFGSFEAYRNAKWNINRFQKPGDLLVVDKALQKDIVNQYPEVKLMEVREVKNAPLKGVHNLKNLDAALKAVEKYGVSNEEALACLQEFKPLPHRLEYVGKFGGVHFYNDSIATVPEAVMEAVKALEKVHTIILGGYDRGLDYAELLCFLRDHPEVKNLIFTGEAGDIMYRMINTQPKNGKEFFYTGNMEEIFKVIREHTPAGAVCLLSPAAASYDMYHNFEHRGDVFKKYAQSFKNRK